MRDRSPGFSTWRQEVADYGLQRVQECYTQERVAERLIATWRTILDQRGKGDMHGD